jgi:[acyl-carrier-protein] S-malonyltransferase
LARLTHTFIADAFRLRPAHPGNCLEQTMLEIDALKDRLPTTAFAFRGYNVTNLGRSRELLAHPLYGPVVERHLQDAGEVCSKINGRRVNLVRRVQRGTETTLRSYGEAIALIVAMEMAQLQILEDFFDVPYHGARVLVGYSLGEITSLIAGGVIPLRCALEIPLSLADDCVKLSAAVKLGILFCRDQPLPLDEIRRLCILVNQLDEGVMGISTYLSPNSLLLMGEEHTLDHFKQQLMETVAEPIILRQNKRRWPPLHTPILYHLNIPNRAAEMMHRMPIRLQPPIPPVLSMVTGEETYNRYNTRELLHRWTDHPQRLWDVVYATLSMGIDTVVHVGPEPNLIPATYRRLQDNVQVLTRGSARLRALSAAVQRPWLSAILPKRSALLRAPHVHHIILEDWLLERDPVVAQPTAEIVA